MASLPGDKTNNQDELTRVFKKVLVLPVVGLNNRHTNSRKLYVGSERKRIRMAFKVHFPVIVIIRVQNKSKMLHVMTKNGFGQNQNSQKIEMATGNFIT